MPKLPISPVTLPSGITPSMNGKIPTSTLVGHVFPGYKSQAYAHKIAMRAYLAMAQALKRATGVTLTITGLGDAYRNLTQQENALFSRADVVSRIQYLVSSPTKRRTYQGKYYVIRPGQAVVATPGLSNHGYAIAFDMAMFTAAGTRINIGNSPAAVDWLVIHARDFGFSWESQSEVWHVRRFTGDVIQKATLDAEAGQDPTPVPVPPPGDLIKAAPPASLTIDQPVDADTLHRTRWLQQICNERFGSELTVDGQFGEMTEDAVVDMQRTIGASQDGQYGPKTAAKLAAWLAQH